MPANGRSAPDACHSFFKVILCVLLCLLTLTAMGCPKKNIGSGGVPYSTPRSKGPRGTAPYTVMGKTYYPLLTANGYREDGVASWYGNDFHGKATSNGERYDMYGLTAAHKLLPFGTMLRVINLDNGKEVTVRVNDRGPFVKDRIIDLTYTGAERIGMLGTGTARVRLETFGFVPGMQNNELTGRFYVQIGAFSQEQNASKLAATMNKRGLAARNVYAPNVFFWRVQIGPYNTLSEAERATERMSGEYPGAFVIAD